MVLSAWKQHGTETIFDTPNYPWLISNFRKLAANAKENLSAQILAAKKM